VCCVDGVYWTVIFGLPFGQQQFEHEYRFNAYAALGRRSRGLQKALRMHRS
jgi:hypothetical protein